jgi:hypothetical protein
MARAREAGFAHQEIDLRALPALPADAATADTPAATLERTLAGYRGRVAAIVEFCHAHGIEPVLVTQSALYGEAIDPATGVNLATVQVKDGTSGALSWRRLELYNDVTRRVAVEQRVLLVDAAHDMPKDSRLYYDFIHLTNEGAERLGAIVAGGVERSVRGR